MEINSTSKISLNPQIRDNSVMPEKDFKTIQKEVFDKMYKKACQEIPQEGQFESIIEEFENPISKKVFSMEITPCHIEGMQQKRYLSLGCEIPDSPNKMTYRIVNGTKQDILSYLSNAFNLNEINSYCNALEDRVDNL